MYLWLMTTHRPYRLLSPWEERAFRAYREWRSCLCKSAEVTWPHGAYLAWLNLSSPNAARLHEPVTKACLCPNVEYHWTTCWWRIAVVVVRTSSKKWVLSWVPCRPAKKNGAYVNSCPCLFTRWGGALSLSGEFSELSQRTTYSGTVAHLLSIRTLSTSSTLSALPSSVPFLLRMQLQL